MDWADIRSVYGEVKSTVSRLAGLHDSRREAKWEDESLSVLLWHFIIDAINVSDVINSNRRSANVIIMEQCDGL